MVEQTTAATVGAVRELRVVAGLLRRPDVEAVLVVASGCALLIGRPGDETVEYARLAYGRDPDASPADAGNRIRTLSAPLSVPTTGPDQLRLLGVEDGDVTAWIDGVTTGFDSASDSARTCVLGRCAETGVLALTHAVRDLHRATLPATPPSLREALAAESITLPAPLCVTVTDQPWARKTRDGRRYVALCGPAGTDGGVTTTVLSSAITAGHGAFVDWIGQGGPAILVLRGDSGRELVAAAGRVRAKLEGGADLFATAAAVAAEPDTGRYRAALVAADTARMLKEIDLAERFLPARVDAGERWATPSGSYCTGNAIGDGGKVAFVYPGAFAMYPGAEGGLLSLFPALLAGVEVFESRPFDALAVREGYLRSATAPSDADVDAHTLALRSDLGFTASTGVYYGLLSTPMLKEVLGIFPDGALGYSMGEICMLWGMDVWTKNENTVLGVRQSPALTRELYGERSVVRAAWNREADDDIWRTVVLAAPVDAVRAAVAEHDRVYITHINTNTEVVVAGDPAQCTALVERMRVPAVWLPGGGPVLHVPLVDAAEDSLRKLTDHDLGAGTSARLYFAARKQVDLRNRSEITDTMLDLCRTQVDFRQLCDAAYEEGFRYFIEVGPGSDCTRWIGTNLAGRPHTAVSVDQRGKSAAAALAQALAQLISAGLDIDLARLFATVAGSEPIADTGPAFVVEDDVLDGGEFETITIVDAELAEAHRTAHLGDGRALADPDGLSRTFVEAAVAAETSPGGPARAGSRRAVMVAETGATTTLDVAEVRAVPRGLAAAARIADARPARAVEPVVASAVAVARAHIAVLETQAALQELMVRELDSVAGYASSAAIPAPVGPTATGVVPPAAQTVVGNLRDEHGCTLQAELVWAADDRHTVHGRVGSLPLVSAASTILAQAFQQSTAAEDTAGYAPRLSELRIRWLDRPPLCGQPVRHRVQIEDVRNSRDGIEFGYTGTFEAGGEVIAELGGSGRYAADHGVDTPTPLEPRARSRRALRGRGFKAFARSSLTALTSAQLHRLSLGELAAVYGGQWDQRMPGTNSAVCIAAPGSLLLDSVTRIDRQGGAFRFGTLTGTQTIDPAGWYLSPETGTTPTVPPQVMVEAAGQLLRTYAVHLGMHLMFADGEVLPAPGIDLAFVAGRPVTAADHRLRYDAEIIELTMVPRPMVVANVHVHAGDELVATLEDLAIEIRERPGSNFRPEMRADGPVFLGRYGLAGEVALAHEFHLSHMENGELDIAVGPVADDYRGKTLLYIPNGEFRFVDRIVTMTPADERLYGGQLVSEYDAHADSWFFEDNSFSNIPASIVMESSLQAAAVAGVCLGTTRAAPPEEKLSVRNLDGTATFLADIDIRDKSWRQEITLLSTHWVLGQILQRFRYRIEVDGVPYYEGTSLFGYFTDQALAAQVGLDSGRSVPLWIDEQDRASLLEVIELDVATDPRCRPKNGLRLGDGYFRLVDTATVVPGGGRHGLGYLAGSRSISPDDWYFDCHFHTDPVMPGSLGVEAVQQALQVYVLAADLAAGLGEVEFAVPVDIPFKWIYRGQILRHETRMDYELDITDIRQTPTGLVVLAKASVFRPGMRIYQFDDIAVEVRRKGASS
ncbi:hypothetical protein [Nocardia lijiangensis]|uniref:hypothetical protein n=1 Tax=Nocardia lijiangensis TaxID=299618 RepID=UPI003D742B43